MVAGSGRQATVGDALALRRHARLVGREAEVELLRATLESDEPPFCVLFVHGPGGIGKTTLLNVFASLAVEAGVQTVRLDGFEVEPTPAAVLQRLGAVLDVCDDGPIGSSAGRLVVIIDAYEHLAPLDDWFRTWLLPRLPASTVVVVAGRQPPGSEWRADPGWRDLLRVVSLDNLSRDESRAYLRACGIHPAVHEQLVDTAHGHPLGLSLLADVAARGGEPRLDPSTPDVVGVLLQRFVDVVPSEAHRRALGACALARATTEALLRTALGTDWSRELFDWLAGLSFVDAGRDGLYPHELARDALDADLRWRDPAGFREVFRGVRAHVSEALTATDGHEQLRTLYDLKFLFRNLPGVLAPVDWDSWAQAYPQPARSDEHPAILGLVGGAEGAASAAIAERWLVAQPEGFFVVRDEVGGVRGALGLLDLTAASDEVRAADPGAQAAWQTAQRLSPPRGDEVVTQTRFIVDRDAYQGPSPTLNAVPVLTLQRFLQTPNLAWDFLALAEPEPWDEFFAVADMPRTTEADFVVTGRRYGQYRHDFRQVPVDALIEVWTERALSQDLRLPPRSTSDVVVLSHHDFVAAARQALRDLHRPDLLARNPLRQTRWARAHASDADAGTLQDLLREAIDTLGADPRDDKLRRAVEETYLRPAGTQEAAAAALGLAFSTYRRHLSQGVERVTAWLWDREVSGAER